MACSQRPEPVVRTLEQNRPSQNNLIIPLPPLFDRYTRFRTVPYQGKAIRHTVTIRHGRIPYGTVPDTAVSVYYSMDPVPKPGILDKVLSLLSRGFTVAPKFPCIDMHRSKNLKAAVTSECTDDRANQCKVVLLGGVQHMVI
ncbi:hypothetical protein SCHPADRAFT_890082 [Schizopora paradoxa]|uniref:Uncharacterized protein n=1 Tax=Schizopora paradoxa TaxID=27342 RepID=A0A0H2RNX1_9AGAM|nr:hypothetical protein SCHPADRAFT_890082 [Schizopora paradoxa]